MEETSTGACAPATLDVPMPKSVQLIAITDPGSVDNGSLLDHILIDGHFNYRGTNYSRDAIISLCSGIHILYLFSGPRRQGDFAEACEAISATCTLVDTVLDGDNMDLMDQHVFETHLKRISDRKAQGLVEAMPCSSFSFARSDDDGGPRPLRGPELPELLGFDYLDPGEKDIVKVGTTLAHRGSTAANLCLSLGVPWVAETPYPRPGAPSLTKLPSWKAILESPGVEQQKVAQCELGGDTTKHTLLWGTVDFNGMPDECKHDTCSWIVPWSGHSYRSPHPKLRGTQWAIPANEWTSSMRRWGPPKGPFITKLGACYPPRMNMEIAVRVCIEAALQRRMADPPMCRRGYWGNQLVMAGSATDRVRRPISAAHVDVPKVAWTQPRMRLKEAGVPQTGDLRNVDRAVAALPGHRVMGAKASLFINDFLENNPSIQVKCLQAIGAEIKSQAEVISCDMLAHLRKQLMIIIKSACPFPLATLPAKTDEFIDTSIDAETLYAWAQAAGDPGAAVATWLTTGAPAGIRVPFAELEGIMAKVEDDQAHMDPSLLCTDWADANNHGPIEDDPEVCKTFKDLVEKRFLHSCDSYEECVRFLGEEPVLNKFACIYRHKWSKSLAKWVIKRRVIMDSKRSGVKAASSRSFKSVLPRITDAVASLMNSMDDAKQAVNIGVEQFVIDAEEAFWMNPLHPMERKYFVGIFKGKYLIYLRTAQGSRGAPVTWAAVFGLICRCVQSMFFTPCGSGRCSHDTSLQVYVDDPWAAVVGDMAKRDRSMAACIVCWRILGINLAFAKAQRGASVDWIGCSISVQSSDTVHATIAADRLDELRELTDIFDAGNVIKKKELRSYVGKAQSIASLLHTWRPFISMLWAALYAPHSGAPPGCVWHKQVAEPLSWIRAFNRECKGNILRVFQVAAYFNKGTDIKVCVDASPFGIGAWLCVNGIPTEYFADVITDLDCANLLIEDRSGSRGQQAFEALALLVAIRQWLPARREARIVVTLRGDNIAALYAVTKMQPKSNSLGVVARELALDLSQASYAIDVAEHVSGLTNTIADVLSRKYQEDKTFVLPSPLKYAFECTPQARDAKWWKARPAMLSG